MPLEFDCRECGEAFVPTRGDVLAGPGVYRVCPDCRVALSDGAAEPVADDPGAVV